MKRFTYGLLALSLCVVCRILAGCSVPASTDPPVPVETEMTRDAAIQKVIDEVLTPAGLGESDVVVYGPEEPLTASDEVWPVLSADGSDAQFRMIDKTTWFFWIDLAPFAGFVHPTQFVYVDDATGAVEVEDQKWYAVINDEELLPIADMDDPRRVFGDPVHPDSSSDMTEVDDDTTETAKFVFPETITPGDHLATPQQSNDEFTVEQVCDGYVAVIVNTWPNSLNTKLDFDNITSELSARGHIPHQVVPHPNGNAASRESIFSTLDNLAGDRDVPLCQILFYYTGHGTGGNLIMGNDQKGSVQIGTEEIARKIAAIDACEFVIILDCCESGSFVTLFPLLLRDLLKERCKPGVVYAACDRTELAWTDASGGGTYTNELITLIRQTPRDETIDFAESGSQFQVPKLGVFRTQVPQTAFVMADEDCPLCGLVVDDDDGDDDGGGGVTNLPPSVEPIVAVFDPEGQSTDYTVSATDPDGDTLIYSWWTPSCGDDSLPLQDMGLTNVFRWTHPHPPCDPTTDHVGETASVTVTDGVWQVVCTYQGASSGTGPACGAATMVNTGP